MTSTTDLLIMQFWPTTFYSRVWPEHRAEAAGIVEFLYQLRAKQNGNIASGVALGSKSAQGLFEGTFDLFAADHPGLNKLKAFIGQSVQLAVAHANGATAGTTAPSPVDPRRIRVAIVESWFHITNDGGFHDAHYHSGCSWCGIYYLQVEDAAAKSDGSAPNGANRFYSPFAMGGGYKDYGNKYLDTSYVEPPLRDGQLILFPSYLWHSALSYRGQKDRVVIAFNSRSELVA